MKSERSVLHLNVADFAVAVERLVDVRLREWPVIVAAQGAGRAVVHDMSEEAFQVGVRKGMTVQRAQKLCREIRMVAPHPDRYERAMKDFFERVRPYSPLVEAEETSGHLFVDLTGTGRLFGPPPDVAWRLRRTVRTELGLDPIWALAPNKLVAKVATRLVKPIGEYIVEPGEEEEFLSPRPLVLLPGVEREDLQTFRDFHVSRVGQAAQWSPSQLEVVFGKRGQHLHRLFLGHDDAPVRPVDEKSPGLVYHHDFPEDTNDAGLVYAALARLVEKAGFALREQNRAARQVAVRLDYTDGVRLFRRKADPHGTADDFKLLALAKTALDLAWQRRVRLRRLSLTVSRLAYPPSQLELFPLDEEQPERKTEPLLTALDAIRRRFGSDLIRSGRTIYRSYGLN